MARRRKPSKWDEERWSGRRPKSTPGYTWRRVRCPYCDCSYRYDITLKDIFDHPWNAVKAIIGEETAQRESNHDYSHPGHRGLVLGRMYELKQELWYKHIAECRASALQAAIEGHLIEDEDAFESMLSAIPEGVTALEYIEKNSTPF